MWSSSSYLLGRRREYKKKIVESSCMNEPMISKIFFFWNKSDSFVCFGDNIHDTF